MKRIFFTLVFSFLVLVAAKANTLYLISPSTPPSSINVGQSVTFSFAITNALHTIIVPYSGTPTATFTANTDPAGPAAGTAIESPDMVTDPNAFKVVVSPSHNGSFTILVSASDGINTYTQSFTINAVLAVELEDFTAKSISSSKVNLNWITASEKDNSMFKVETSTNGIVFSAIGEVKGMGTSEITHTYTYTDNNSYDAAVVYYRLTAVDFAGVESTSKVVSVVTGNKGKLSLDNVNGATGRVIFVSPSSDKVTLAVYNTAGQVVYTSDLSAFQGANNITANITNLNSGLYIARLSNTTDASTVKFFVGR